MSTLRFQALKEASSRNQIKFEETDRKSTIFGSNVFNEKAMKQYLLQMLLKRFKAPFNTEQKLIENWQITLPWE
jgi:glutamine synthetase type III